MWLEGFMECHLGFDAAFCPNPVPDGYSWCMVYAGGSSATHPWTDAELARVAHLPRLPVWVPTPGTDLPVDAANGLLAWLRAHNVPEGAHVMWDMETGTAGGDDPPWLEKAAAILAASGYLNLVYGSLSVLFGPKLMPRRDGYVVANPTGVPHLYPRAGVRATQFAFDVRTPGGVVDETAMERDLAGQLWMPS